MLGSGVLCGLVLYTWALFWCSSRAGWGLVGASRSKDSPFSGKLLGFSTLQIGHPWREVPYKTKGGWVARTTARAVVCASSAIFEENSSVLLYNFSDPRGGWQGAPCLGVLYNCKQTLFPCIKPQGSPRLSFSNNCRQMLSSRAIRP